MNNCSNEECESRLNGLVNQEQVDKEPGNAKIIRKAIEPDPEPITYRRKKELLNLAKNLGDLVEAKKVKWDELGFLDEIYHQLVGY